MMIFRERGPRDPTEQVHFFEMDCLLKVVHVLSPSAHSSGDSTYVPLGGVLDGDSDSRSLLETTVQVFLKTFLISSLSPITQ